MNRIVNSCIVLCLLLARPSFVTAQTSALESFTNLSGWKAGSENNAGAKGRFVKTGATAALVIDQDTPGKDVLEYTKQFGRDLSGDESLVFRYRTAPGSHLSLRASIDGETKNLLSSRRAMGSGANFLRRCAVTGCSPSRSQSPSRKPIPWLSSRKSCALTSPGSSL
jgi:hypothetical protein